MYHGFMVTLEHQIVAPQKKRWTVDELLAMEKAGLLDPEKRIELLDGEVYEMPPTSEGHASSVDWLVRLFLKQFDERAVVRSQNPIRLDDEDLPLPDLALLEWKEDFYRQGHPRPENVYLVVEVSDATLWFDRSSKLKRYAKAGLREVWIVNLKDRQTEVFRDPSGEEYLTRFVVKPGESVAPLAFPDDPIPPL
ncbi:Uma2 family endonuclease [Meiothermus sp. PNK-Is4]|nr:Uma2 family endonuclease [Meiothermus sp. Pnk-1]RYM37001.1 Uma2 family endonuclease [Meiothermus sp. PNK-Is4]